jgi:hypothetical protein
MTKSYQEKDVCELIEEGLPLEANRSIDALLGEDFPDEHPNSLTLGTIDNSWFDEKPPPIEALVYWNMEGDYIRKCMIPKGEVGFVAGAGGVGKSFFVIELAMAVATQRPFLNIFDVSPKGGKVLLIMGETSPIGLKRRFHTISNYFLDLSHGRSEKERFREDLKANFRHLCLAGDIKTLVKEDGRPSTWQQELVNTLKSEESWSLIIVDPMSRFMGADTEQDASAATKFIQTIEGLTKGIPGEPTVIITAHTNKSSREKESIFSLGGNSMRGSSALFDGCRFGFMLVHINTEEEKLIENLGQISTFNGKPIWMKMVKNNEAFLIDAPYLLQKGQDGILIIEDAKSKAVVQGLIHQRNNKKTRK